MADSRAAGILAAFRTAARSSECPFVVQAVDAEERRRIESALLAEGKVDAWASLEEALASLGQRQTDIAILDLDRGTLDVDPVAAVTELYRGTGLILLVDGEPARIGKLFSGAIHSVLPRPLPESDALLRAHLRWLVAGRRSRARGAAIAAVLGRHRAELETLEPAMVTALEEASASRDVPVRFIVLGPESFRQAVANPDRKLAMRVDREPEVVVLGAAAGADIAASLREARTAAAGAAVLLVDLGPTPARVVSALYGGARAYLSPDEHEQIAEVLVRVGQRRRAEVQGRKSIEALARFAVFDAADDAPDTAVTPRPTPAAAFVPSGHEVLVVDDEIVVLTVLREALRRGGYRVTTARSAEEAIALLGQRSFDVVLTDKNLTGASGLEVLRFARTLTPAPAGILITGYSSYDSAVEAMDLGALDYIEKPIRDVELLRQRVRRALNRRDEQQSRDATRSPALVAARVLLVEVAADKRALLTEFLSRTYSVVSAADGDEALEKLKAERFDVVLADRNLPGMMGLRVLEQARQLLPHCASVLYTAYPSFESVREAFEVGADAVAVRPSEDLKSLQEKVAGALRSKGGILLG